MNENVISVETIAIKFYSYSQTLEQQTCEMVKNLQVFITAIDSDNWTGPLKSLWF